MDPRTARSLRMMSSLPALGIGAWLLYIGWVGPLENIVGYRDSPVYVYLAIGSIFVLPGLCLIGYALRVIVRAGR